MEPGAASDVPQWHVEGTGSMSVGAISLALASSPRLRPITGARACSPGTSAKDTTATFPSMA
jgi:hypothetical protein